MMRAVSQKVKPLPSSLNTRGAKRVPIKVGRTCALTLRKVPFEERAPYSRVLGYAPTTYESDSANGKDCNLCSGVEWPEAELPPKQSHQISDRGCGSDESGTVLYRHHRQAVGESDKGDGAITLFSPLIKKTMRET